MCSLCASLCGLSTCALLCCCCVCGRAARLSRFGKHATDSFVCPFENWANFCHLGSNVPFWTFGLRDLKLEIQRKPQEEEEESKKAIHTFISVLCGAESVPSLDLLLLLFSLPCWCVLSFPCWLVGWEEKEGIQRACECVRECVFD